jgi:hypothetical protein
VLVRSSIECELMVIAVGASLTVLAVRIWWLFFADSSIMTSAHDLVNAHVLESAIHLLVVTPIHVREFILSLAS